MKLDYANQMAMQQGAPIGSGSAAKRPLMTKLRPNRSAPIGSGSAAKRPDTLTEGLCQQLADINARLGHLVMRHVDFIGRILPPEPREGNKCPTPEAPTPEIAIYLLESLLTGIRANLDDLEYYSNRMEKIG